MTRPTKLKLIMIEMPSIKDIRKAKKLDKLELFNEYWQYFGIHPQNVTPKYIDNDILHPREHFTIHQYGGVPQYEENLGTLKESSNPRKPYIICTEEDLDRCIKLARQIVKNRIEENK